MGCDGGRAGEEEKGRNKQQVRMRKNHKDQPQDVITDTKGRRWLAKSREPPAAPEPRRQLAAGPTLRSNKGLLSHQTNALATSVTTGADKR